MANTFTQIFIQFIFSPKFHASLIHMDWENELYKYFAGIIQNTKHKLICINGMPDHVHIFVGFHTTQSIADFMQDIKAGSSKWINENHLTKLKFEWQSGYGGFSYSKSQVLDVIKYIENQKEHHKKISFLDEYKSYLEQYGIEYDEKYIFKIPE